jgi:hypothetical protein
VCRFTQEVNEITMDKLIDYINSVIRLDNNHTTLILNVVKKESHLKGDYLLKPQQCCSKIWFVAKGMVRKYKLLDGNEKTSWLFVENDIFTNLQSFCENTMSDEYLQVCEDTELISITKCNCVKLASFTQLVILSNLLLKKAFVNIDNYSVNLNTKNARGKYEYLCKVSPELVKRAKLSYLASILGITRETLSRVRKASLCDKYQKN